jgi:SSS family solute:Na+ symporter
MTAQHYIGAAMVLGIITAMGIYSGRRVKSASDFLSGGKKAGVGIVAGSILGTLVGGASTIGTAQLAFSYGFSAWWFTLGGGIGCLVLALFFSKPFHNSPASTLPQIFSREYGQNAGTAATLLTSLGSFLSIVSQILSGVALITAVSRLSLCLATLLIVVLMLVYVVFGGVWGAGYVGMAKTVLLYTAVGGCGLLAMALQGGVGAFRAALPAERYFSLFARGLAVDGGAGLSLVLGVLTTQAYIQALMSAKSLRISRIGALISAGLVPLVGIGGIFVGMYMRLNYPDIQSGTALPRFIMEHLPPVMGGAVLATLLVALVGTGAGISLGLSSMISNDIYKVYINKNADDNKNLWVNRMVIGGILALAAVFSGGNMGSLILGWSFLSMGLRGAVAFGPLCTALFLPGRIPGRYALLSMVVGPVLVLLGKLMLPAHIDPLFLGVLGNLAILGLGLYAGQIGKDKTHL